MDTPETGDEQRFRPQARAAFVTAVSMLAAAGLLTLLGHTSAAVGPAWLGGASLLLSGIYLIMYRV